MFKPILLATALISTLGAGVAAAAPPPRNIPPARAFAPPRFREIWRSLGEVRLSGGRHARSAVLVPERGAGPVQKLRFIARGADLGRTSVRVTFGNGETFDTAIGGESSVIDLPGQSRNIRSIELQAAGYGRRGRMAQASIEVLGESGAMPRHAFR